MPNTDQYFKMLMLTYHVSNLLHQMKLAINYLHLNQALLIHARLLMLVKVCMYEEVHVMLLSSFFPSIPKLVTLIRCCLSKTWPSDLSRSHNIILVLAYEWLLSPFRTGVRMLHVSGEIHSLSFICGLAPEVYSSLSP